MTPENREIRRYIPIAECDRTALEQILNDPRVRRHLVYHPLFDPAGLEKWVASKADMDRTVGCRVRGVLIHGRLAGWCGIQVGRPQWSSEVQEGRHDLGIVLDPAFWGHGPAIFRDMLEWSREMGHPEVYVYLLESRRESKAIMARGAPAGEVRLMDRTFRAYRIPV